MSEIEIEIDQQVFEVTQESSQVIEINTSSVIYRIFPAGSRYNFFTPADNQSVFTLTEMPTGDEILLSRAFVNGQKLKIFDNYTIIGTQLTIILPYSLLTTDSLEIYY